MDPLADVRAELAAAVSRRDTAAVVARRALETAAERLREWQAVEQQVARLSEAEAALVAATPPAAPPRPARHSPPPGATMRLADIVVDEGLAKTDDVTRERVRDFVCQQPERFSLIVVMRTLDLGRDLALRYMQEFAEAGMVVRHEDDGSFEYVPPDSRGAPTHRPRGEQRVAPTQAASRGQTVPHTGKPIGRSGKPGKDRKAQRAGKPMKAVKHKGY